MKEQLPDEERLENVERLILKGGVMYLSTRLIDFYAALQWSTPGWHTKQKH